MPLWLHILHARPRGLKRTTDRALAQKYQEVARLQKTCCEPAAPLPTTACPRRRHRRTRTSRQGLWPSWEPEGRSASSRESGSRGAGQGRKDQGGAIGRKGRRGGGRLRAGRRTQRRARPVPTFLIRSKGVRQTGQRRWPCWTRWRTQASWRKWLQVRLPCGRERARRASPQSQHHQGQCCLRGKGSHSWHEEGKLRGGGKPVKYKV